MLDLGAAGGELGSAIRPLFEKTIGFEYDLERLPALRGHFDCAVVADLEKTLTLPARIQTLVLADVLEHLRHPGKVLHMARESLTNDGRLFLSVPNIANITIRLGLLAGTFRYRDRGILDATHLRFYTSRTIREEVRDAGFEVLLMRGSSIPIRLIVGNYLPEWVLRPLESLLEKVTQIWKSLFAYQIILVARKRDL